jgi:membrane protein implicated in regulation of membrane protease activity
VPKLVALRAVLPTLNWQTVAVAILSLAMILLVRRLRPA